MNRLPQVNGYDRGAVTQFMSWIMSDDRVCFAMLPGMRFVPPPRRLRTCWTAAMMVFAGRLFSLPFLAIGMLQILLIAWWPIVEWAGRDVVAVITNKVVHQGKGVHNLAQYQFEVAGETYQGSMNLSAVEFNNLEIGEKLDVRIAPIFPGLIPHPRHVGATSISCLLAFAFAWNVPLYFLVRQVWMVPFRRKTLLMFGKETVGKVESIEEKRTGRGCVYSICFSYLPPEEPGASVLPNEPVVVDAAVSKEFFRSVRVGDDVTVFVDPQNPRRSELFDWGYFDIEGLRTKSRFKRKN